MMFIKVTKGLTEMRIGTQCFLYSTDSPDSGRIFVKNNSNRSINDSNHSIPVLHLLRNTITIAITKKNKPWEVLLMYINFH